MGSERIEDHLLQARDVKVNAAATAAKKAVRQIEIRAVGVAVDGADPNAVATAEATAEPAVAAQDTAAVTDQLTAAATPDQHAFVPVDATAADATPDGVDQHTLEPADASADTSVSDQLTSPVTSQPTTPPTSH